MNELYQQTMTTIILHPIRRRPAYLHDGVENNHVGLHAQVRSGDYLGMLASQLDELAVMIALTAEPEAANLQEIVETLLFLQANYKLTRKY